MGLKIFSALKYEKISGEFKRVTFVASKQEDGFCYFGDSERYRCRSDGSNMQIYYPFTDRWVNTENVVISSDDEHDYDPVASDENITENRTRITSIEHGQGTVAGHIAIETAVLWWISKCSSHNVTYSNDVRWGPNSYDCSSFVLSGLIYAGFDVDKNKCYNTMTMRHGIDGESGLEELGFVWHPAPANKSLPASMLERGDIMLNIGNHTQVYTGNNQDANCGGTPASLMPHWSYYDWPGASYYGWDGFLRYDG